MNYQINFNKEKVERALELWHCGGPANDAIDILEEQLKQVNNIEKGFWQGIQQDYQEDKND